MSDLLTRTAELVAISSPSHHEGPLADEIERILRPCPWLEVERLGHNVVARTAHGRPQRLLIAGHLDTVPANGNTVPRIEGDTLWGLGAADMKGGLAVMIELAVTATSPAVDLTFVFYVAEEVARIHNGLLAVHAARPDLLAGDSAILCEPTGSIIEAGCQGVLKLEVTITGRRAHAARSWMGVNAIHRLGPVLDRIAAFQPRQPLLDGCRYREALQAVMVTGGVANNVIPDLATVTLSHRFAPDRTAEEAGAAMGDWLSPVLDLTAGDAVKVVESSPAAPPSLDHPLLAALEQRTASPARAKLGWTDVAFFAEHGVPATNFGPGDPVLAHTAGERIERADLDAALRLLRAVVGAA